VREDRTLNDDKLNSLAQLSQNPVGFGCKVSGLLMSTLVSIVIPWAQAFALDFGYSGRLTDVSGQPLNGPVELTIRFYHDPQNSDLVGPTLKIPGVELVDGVFQVALNVDDSQVNTIFGDGSKAVYIEV